LRFTKPDLPAIAAESNDLKAIRKAVVDAAGVGAGLWLTKVDLTGAHLQPAPPSGKKQDEAETEGYRENVVYEEKPATSRVIV
jgi:hypothetical protein